MRICKHYMMRHSKMFLHSAHALLQLQTVDPRIQQKQMAATTTLTTSEYKTSREIQKKHIYMTKILRNAFDHKLVEKCGKYYSMNYDEHGQPFSIFA